MSALPSTRSRSALASGKIMAISARLREVSKQLGSCMRLSSRRRKSLFAASAELKPQDCLAGKKSLCGL